MFETLTSETAASLARSGTSIGTSSLRVSVVLTNFMHESFVEEAILSVLNQTTPAHELIIVDDGSTDGSHAIIERYRGRATVILKSNGGHSSAINAGCAEASGDVLCFLDSDDRFAPTKIAELTAAWHANRDATMVYHQLRTIDAHGVPRGNPWPRRLLEGEISDRVRPTAGWWPRPTTSGLSFSRTYLKRVLPIPTGPRVWPDTYLAPPAAFCGRIVAIPRCLGDYRVHGKNTILVEFPPNVRGVAKRSQAQRWEAQYDMERQLLTDCLTRLGIDASDISLGQHLGALSAQRDAGRGLPMWRHVYLILTNPALPDGMRLTTLARFLRSRLG